MQTDIWLTESVQPTQCPLCSKPLKASSKTCYACGFSLESPTSTNTASSVWIDPAIYTYQPSESASTSAQPSKRSNVSSPAPKPVGSVVWEGNEQAQDSHPSTQPQSQTRQRTNSTSTPSTGKHASTVSKAVAKPVHMRRRTYTRSLSQTHSGNPPARPSAPQPPMWQYESPNFEAGSSLPSLSLLIAEAPTQPGVDLPEKNVQQSTNVGATFMAPQIDPFPPIPTDDSWLVGNDEAESAFDALEKRVSISRSLSSFTDSPPRPAHRTRLLPDNGDGTAIDEIDTVPPLLSKRSHALSAEDSFLISGASLLSDVVPIAEPTEDAQGSFDQSNLYPNALQSSQAPASEVHIEEIDTIPEHLGAQFIAPSQDGINHAPTFPAHLASLDTAPDHVGVQFIAPGIAPSASRALVPINSQVTTIPATASSSWTAGGSTRSSYARHIADRSRRKKHRPMLSLNPLDSVRWWLLRPGRIEFLLWLGGTILLVSVTCVLLLVTAFSFNWITPGLRNSVTSSAPSLTSTSPKGHPLPTVTVAPGLAITLLEKGPFLPSGSIHVRGQGFTPNGQVDFTLDNPQLPSHPISVQANPRGAFTTTLSYIGLSQGLHLLIAHDMKTESLAVIPFSITEGDTGNRATATPAPVIPGTTVTPTPGQPAGGGNPATPTPIIGGTPVGQTPVPTTPTPTPTKAPTPTPTPVPPTPTPSPVPPTPTPGTTPTPVPSPSAVPTSPSPTASASPTAAVPPSPSPTATSSPTAAMPLSRDSGPGGGLSNALDSNTPALSAQITRLAPWLWLPMLFYILSMLMLGLAGVLHKRRG